jgi:polysaccharide biosynthesis transport protein
MQTLFRRLFRRRLVILVSLVTAVATSILLSRYVPRTYEAGASFYVPVAQDVFSLSTNEAGGTARAVPAPTVVRDQLRGYFGILSSGRVATRVAEVIPERNVQQIRRNTRFQLSTSGMFLITTTDRDPIIAARIANAYADSFNDLFEEISLPRAAKTRRFIEEQLEKVRMALATAEGEQETFKRRYRTVSLSEETTHLVKFATDLHALIEMTTVQQEETRTRVSVVEARLASEARMQLSSTMVTANPVIQQLEGRLGELEVELAGLRAKYTEAHPDVVRARRQVAEARRRLSDEVQQVVSSETRSLNAVHETLRQTLTALYADERAGAAKLAGLRDRLRVLERQMEDLPDRQRQLGELTRTVKHLEETDRMLALKLEDARIQEKRELQTFLVVDRAEPSETPAYPNLLQSVPAAAILGLLAGLLYALALSVLEVAWDEATLRTAAGREEARADG